jgi:hypothetical protein
MAKSKQTLSKAQLDQRARALNPNNQEFKVRMDHHADQLNDNQGTPGINPARKAVVDNTAKQTKE